MCIFFNHVERSSSIILVWKKDTAVLTAGNLKVTTNPRIRLMPPQQNQIDVGSRSSSLSYSNSYNLEIRDVRVEDAGDYVCQISTIKPREISHILEVLGKFNIFRFTSFISNHFFCRCLIP